VLAKPGRRQSKDERKRVRGKPCVVCGSTSDACHVQSRGAGGGDESWNLVPMCRKHHSEQHKRGWFDMCQLYWSVEAALEERGWAFDSATGLVKLVRKG
jgi:hypothetical protein